MPKSTYKNAELDKHNQNTFWQDSIATEMKDLCVAFKILDETPSGGPNMGF